MRRDNPQRTFYSIEQVHTLPNVNYLAKVRTGKKKNRQKKDSWKNVFEGC